MVLAPQFTAMPRIIKIYFRQSRVNKLMMEGPFTYCDGEDFQETQPVFDLHSGLNLKLSAGV